jgi:hypothetical protein
MAATIKMKCVRTRGLGEMNDISVLLEQIYLLNTGDVGETHLLEGSSQLLII